MKKLLLCGCTTASVRSSSAVCLTMAQILSLGKSDPAVWHHLIPSQETFLWKQPPASNRSSSHVDSINP